MKKLPSLLLRCIGNLALMLLGFFAAAAVYFCAETGETLRIMMAATIASASVFAGAFAAGWRRKMVILGPVFVLVYGWYASIEPKAVANWSKDVAILPKVEINGDNLTVRHIRNFHYRSDADFDADYYDKTFDLTQVRTVDLFLSYWGTTDIAHTIMSFGFASGEYLPISIETRKESGEEYSAVQGFFKKFELIYVIADENDLIGVRVNQRNEDVYLYRLKPEPDKVRKMLEQYLLTVHELEHKPKFYNALTTNCTTSILPHIRAVQDLKFNWALIANGNLDRWRYEEGIWGFDIPFEEFRRRSRINDKVKQATDSPDFSAQIRKDLPSIRR